MTEKQAHALKPFAVGILTAMGLVSTTIVWSYATFETKEHSNERKEDVVKRLDSIEGKLNRALGLKE